MESYKTNTLNLSLISWCQRNQTNVLPVLPQARERQLFIRSGLLQFVVLKGQGSMSTVDAIYLHKVTFIILGGEY